MTTANKLRHRSICPEHGQMFAQSTQYGRRFACHTAGCTVACWDNETSLPADDETRRLRHECHQAFDPLWKKGGRQQFKKRKDAYRWMENLLQLEPRDSHIGMLDAGQCATLLAAIGER